MTLFLLLFVMGQAFFSADAGSGNEHCCDWTPFWTWEGRQEWDDLYVKYNLKSDEVSQNIVPQTYLIIQFGNQTVYPGDFVSPLYSTSPPKVTWICDPTKFYKLLLINPDALGTNKGNQYLNWEVEGITNCDIDTGTTTSEYFPPVPVAGTCRYIALMFEQSTDTTPDPLKRATKETVGSIDFSTDKYIKKRGCPWAGNFFLSKSMLPVNVDLPLSGLPLSPVTDLTHDLTNGLPL